MCDKWSQNNVAVLLVGGEFAAHVDPFIKKMKCKKYIRRVRCGHRYTMGSRGMGQVMSVEILYASL